MTNAKIVLKYQEKRVVFFNPATRLDGPLNPCVTYIQLKYKKIVYALIALIIASVSAFITAVNAQTVVEPATYSSPWGVLAKLVGREYYENGMSRRVTFVQAAPDLIIMKEGEVSMECFYLKSDHRVVRTDLNLPGDDADRNGCNKKRENRLNLVVTDQGWSGSEQNSINVCGLLGALICDSTKIDNQEEATVRNGSVAIKSKRGYGEPAQPSNMVLDFVASTLTRDKESKVKFAPPDPATGPGVFAKLNGQSFNDFDVRILENGIVVLIYDDQPPAVILRNPYGKMVRLDGFHALGYSAEVTIAEDGWSERGGDKFDSYTLMPDGSLSYRSSGLTDYVGVIRPRGRSLTTADIEADRQNAAANQQSLDAFRQRLDQETLDRQAQQQADQQAQQQQLQNMQMMAQAAGQLGRSVNAIEAPRRSAAPPQRVLQVPAPGTPTAPVRYAQSDRPGPASYLSHATGSATSSGNPTGTYGSHPEYVASNCLTAKNNGMRVVLHNSCSYPVEFIYCGLAASNIQSIFTCGQGGGENHANPGEDGDVALNMNLVEAKTPGPAYQVRFFGCRSDKGAIPIADKNNPLEGRCMSY